MHSTTNKIIKNTASNAIGRAWGMVVNLAITPFLISRLGTERYGLWALAFVIVNYFALFDMGIGSSIVKYVAEHHAKQDRHALLSITSVGTLLYVCFSLVSLIILLSASPLLVYALRIPSYLAGDALALFRGMAIALALVGIATIFRSVLFGMQRMDLVNKIIVIISTGNGIGSWMVVNRGWGLQGLLAVIICMNVLNVLLLYAGSRKVLGRLVDIRSFSKGVAKELFGFGIKVQVSSYSSAIAWQLNKLLVSRFVGISAVSYYDVASKVATTTRDLPMVLVSAIVPAASELNANDDRHRLVRLYEMSSKYLVTLSLPLTMFIGVNSSTLLYIWLGPGFEQAAIVLRILLVGYFIHLLTGPGTTICRGVGKPGYETSYTLVLIGLSIALGVLGTVTLGLLGAALGSTIALVFSSLFFIFLFHSRVIGTRFMEFARRIYGPVIASTIVASLVSWFAFYVIQLALGQSRIFSIVALLASGFFYCISFVFVGIALGYFGIKEVQIFSQVLRFAGLYRFDDIWIRPILMRIIHGDRTK